ncbi:helix-turn-helix domain-containing protein [Symbiopectobacterium sp. Eva_TO]
METKNDKNHRVSFLVGQKETFLSRLRELVAGRALQQAADDWDIPKSTLSNYFYRGSNPRIASVKKIAQKENVDFDWLTGHSDKKPERNLQTQQTQQALSSEFEHDMQAIVAILATLEPGERSQLVKLLGRRGSMYLLGLLDHDNQVLLDLREDRKRAALRMESMSEEQFREILSKIEISTGETISEVV